MDARVLSLMERGPTAALVSPTGAQVLKLCGIVFVNLKAARVVVKTLCTESIRTILAKWGVVLMKKDPVRREFPYQLGILRNKRMCYQAGKVTVVIRHIWSAVCVPPE